MSKNTRVTVASLNADVQETKAEIREIKAMLTTALKGMTPSTPATEPAKAGRKGKKGKSAKAPKATGPSFPELQVRLRAHKAAGAIVAGVSVKQAIEQGLMTPAGDLPGVSTPEAPKAGKKGKKAKGKKAPEATPFPVLRAALKAHKAAGLVEKGVTVKDALAAGLMLPDGSLPGGRKVAAKVEADAPAKVKREVSEDHTSRVAPRRANGTIAPKSEWALREALADSGRFDRHEIDAIVASHA